MNVLIYPNILIWWNFHLWVMNIVNLYMWYNINMIQLYFALSVFIMLREEFGRIWHMKEGDINLY